MWPHRNRPQAKARLESLTTGAQISAQPDALDAPPAQRASTRVLLDENTASKESRSPEDQPRWFWTWDRRSQKAVSILLAGLAIVVAWWWWSGRPAETVVASEVTVSEGVPVATGEDQPPITGEVIVHVVGKVAEPGIVELPAGSRVIDAIEAVGGARNDKALESVNLARIVVDGEQIVVGAPAAGGGDGKVSINAADAAALEQLPGVGPVIAERIVAWRTENGPFRSVAELAEISGIGPAMIERIEDQVRM